MKIKKAFLIDSWSRLDRIERFVFNKNYHRRFPNRRQPKPNHASAGKLPQPEKIRNCLCPNGELGSGENQLPGAF